MEKGKEFFKNNPNLRVTGNVSRDSEIYQNYRKLATSDPGLRLSQDGRGFTYTNLRRLDTASR